MSTAATSGQDSSELGENDFSSDELLEVLSNQRRRFVIHHLKQRRDGLVTVSDLAEQVAAWEYGKPPGQLTHRERKRVRNALRQFHLPKMDDYQFVEYDKQRGTVRLTEVAANANFYVDSITGGDIPWSVYYLGLAALSAVSLVGLWLGAPPFDVLSPLTCGLFFVTALVVSAAGHCYDNYYRMRLGAREAPPEVMD